MPIPFYNGGTGSSSSAPGTLASAVTDRHPDYARHQLQWSRISHVLAGQDSVRDNARAYIPATVEHQQFPDTYQAMIARTPFTNYTARAVDGLEGMIFRKDPDVKIPARYKPRLENINNSGDSINTFSKKAVREVLAYGRAGILVDAQRSEDQRYDSPASLLPHLSLYSAASITNWRPRSVNGEPIPDQIVLQEHYTVPQAFGSITKVRYRVLELDEQDRYRVRLYEQRAGGGDYYLAEEGYPTTGRADGQNFLNKIPFVFLSPVDLSPTVYRSPILDLVDANLAHFLLESEYASALFYSAQPTPVITGWREGEPGNFRFGNGNVWLLPEGCTAEILEFHGHGLGPLERALAAKVEQIAELGARLAQNAATSPETAEASRIRQHSQTSVVSSIARTVSDGIQAALDIACKWGMADGEVSYEMNQDYLDVVMTPQMLMGIGNAVKDGLMTRKDAIWNMQRGELLQPGRTAEQVLAEIDSERPSLAGMPDPAIVRPLRQPVAVEPGTGKRGNGNFQQQRRSGPRPPAPVGE
jgi:hypothetical protein